MQTSTVEEQAQVEAEYMLESAIKCATCSESVEHLIVIRLLRTKVNFTSSLPRRGYIVACPKCRATVSASVDR
jgi:hypothetical protein